MTRGSQVEKFMVAAPKRQIALTKVIDEIYRAYKTVLEECVRSPNWFELTQLRKKIFFKKCTKSAKKCKKVPKLDKIFFFKKCTKSAKTHKSLLLLLWNGKSH